jgi:hypothetical protein
VTPKPNVTFHSGRAIAQAVSRWLPTAAARVRDQFKSCGICGGQSDTGAGLCRVLRFPLSILIPPTTPHSSSIIWGWYNRPNIGRRTKCTQSHPHLKKLKNKNKNKKTFMLFVAWLTRRPWRLRRYAPPESSIDFHRNNPSKKQQKKLAASFMLVPRFVYSSTLKMEPVCSSHTLVDFHRTTRLYIPEDRTP